MDETLSFLVKETVKVHPNKIAVVFNDDYENYFQTYTELWSRAKQIADCIRKENINNRVIGVCIEPSVDLPSILLGILNSSCSYYPFSVDGKSFITHCLNILKVPYILVTSNDIQKLADIINEFKGRIVQSNILSQYNLVLIALYRNHTTSVTHQSDLAYCLTTSGTTGTPKIVCVHHQCIVANIKALSKIFSVCADDKLFLASPLTFDPSVVELFLALTNGASILIVPDYIKKISSKLLDILHNRQKISILQVTPALLYQFNSADLKKALLGNTTDLRILAIGGEEFPPLSIINTWRSSDCRVEFYNLYGITEVSCWSNCYHITENDFRNELKAVPLGKVLDKTNLKVTDNDGHIINSGQGVLWIGSTDRICDIDDEVQANLNNRDMIKWRCSGDIVEIRDDNHIIYISRSDTQIKRNGKRLDLSTIEKTVKEVVGVKQCCTVYDDKILCVFIVSDDTDRTSLDTRIKHHIHHQLPLYYHPDTIKYIDTLPQTSHGKTDKVKLKNLLKENRFESVSIPSSLSDLSLWLKTLWKKHISLVDKDKEEILIEDSSNFILLGGDSLQAVHLTNFLESSLHQKHPLLLENLLNKSFHYNLHSIYQIIHQSSSCFDCEKNLILYGDETYLQNSGNSKRLKIEYENGEMDTRKPDLNESGHFDYFICRGNKIFLCESKHKITKHCTAKEKTSNVCKCEEISKTSAESVENQEKCSLSNGSYNSAVNTDHNKLNLKLIWKHSTGKCVDSSPCIDVSRTGRNVVFIGSHSYKFAALDIDNGDVIWEVCLGDRIESSPCLSKCGRYVIVGCYDGKLYVMDVINGNIKWCYQTGSSIKCSPVLDTKTSLVVFGSHDQCVYAVDIKKERCIWKCTVNHGSVFSSPIIQDNIVYIGTLGGYLIAICMDDGCIQWKYDIRKPIFSSPCYVNNSIVISSVDGFIYSVSVQGELIWKFQTSSPIFCSPVVSLIENKGECIIFGSHDNHLYCLNNQGQLVWTFKSTSQIYSSPFVFSISQSKSLEHSESISDCLCFKTMEELRPVIHGSNEGNLNNENHILAPNIINSNLDQETTNIEYDQSKNSDRPCQEHNQQDFQREVKFDKLKLDCRPKYVVCASTNGEIFILDIFTGCLLFKTRLSGEIFSSPVIYNNRLVIGCRDNHIYCFQIEQT